MCYLAWGRLCVCYESPSKTHREPAPGYELSKIRKKISKANRILSRSMNFWPIACRTFCPSARPIRPAPALVHHDIHFNFIIHCKHCCDSILHHHVPMYQSCMELQYSFLISIFFFILFCYHMGNRKSFCCNKNIKR